jgi:hypothetical protein
LGLVTGSLFTNARITLMMTPVNNKINNIYKFQIKAYDNSFCFILWIFLKFDITKFVYFMAIIYISKKSINNVHNYFEIINKPFKYSFEVLMRT